LGGTSKKGREQKEGMMGIKYYWKISYTCTKIEKWNLLKVIQKGVGKMRKSNCGAEFDQSTLYESSEISQ
jgi:hypothetical protein